MSTRSKTQGAVMMKFLLGTTMFAGLMVAGAAQAADMPLKAPRAAPEVFNWSGFYIGAHFGAAWGTIESEVPLGQFSSRFDGLALPISSHGINGFLGGGQVGYNYQVAPWLVFGVEGQFSAADISGSTPCLILLKCTTDVNWVASLAGRVGFTSDRTMLYAKAGVAWADSDYSASFLGSGDALTASKTRTGFMIGAGIEHAIWNNWSAKLEYNFMDFGTKSIGFGIDGDCCLAVDVNQQIHLIKFGLNYRLWGGRY
jgi:outer membrane immunogenic protein